jgi:hypothetical protein
MPLHVHVHANICYSDNLNHQEKWIVKSLITQPLHQGNAKNLNGMISPVVALCCEALPFGLLKAFIPGSESRQMEFHLA